MGRFNFVSGIDCDMHKAPILAMDYNIVGSTNLLKCVPADDVKIAGATGHVGFIGHKQPVLESHIRGCMPSSHCSLRCNATVVELEEDEDWTYCTYRDATGEEHGLRARFFVGADGKTGYTRKQYLEPRGVILEKFHASDNPLFLALPSLTLQQSLLRGNLGGIELADHRPNTAVASQLPPVGTRLLTRASL